MAKKNNSKVLLDEDEIIRHGTNFSEDNEKGLWEKISRFGGSAGAQCIYYALLLFYTLKNPKIGFHFKALVIGALGYFLLPIDMCSDLIPGFGFFDDISIMLGVLISVSSIITDDIRDDAKKKLEEFGFDSDTEEFDSKIRK